MKNLILVISLNSLLHGVIPFHFQVDTFRQAEERRGGGAEEKRFVSFIM
jgi:hypothetical protein